MQLSRTYALTAAVLLAGTLAACGEAGSEGDGESEVEVEVVENPDFPEGSTMAQLADAGTVTIGTKFDQPGLGFKSATADTPVGFDVEMGKIVAGQLGIAEEDIVWEETISDNREPYLTTGRVDLVAASYSITDERRQLVGQAGPYFLTGQQVLVPADSDVESIEDLVGEEVCSASGSTSLENVTAAGAVGVPADTYSICAEQVADGSVPAMSTDGSILLGLAAQYDGALKVVGPEFSEERIGIGYSKDAPEMCEWINGVLEESFENGNWEAAFDATLGKSGEDAPEPPQLDPCQA